MGGCERPDGGALGAGAAPSPLPRPGGGGVVVVPSGDGGWLVLSLVGCCGVSGVVDGLSVASGVWPLVSVGC